MFRFAYISTTFFFFFLYEGEGVGRGKSPSLIKKKNLNTWEKKHHKASKKKSDKITLLKKIRLARGHFSSLDKIALLTHFPQFHFLFSTYSYFTNILLSIFFTLPISNSISSLISISKRRKDEEIAVKD